MSAGGTAVGAGGTVVGAGGTVVGAGGTVVGAGPKECIRPKRAIYLDLETDSFAAILNFDICLISLTLTGEEFHFLSASCNMRLSL